MYLRIVLLSVCAFCNGILFAQSCFDTTKVDFQKIIQETGQDVYVHSGKMKIVFLLELYKKDTATKYEVLIHSQDTSYNIILSESLVLLSKTLCVNGLKQLFPIVILYNDETANFYNAVRSAISEVALLINRINFGGPMVYIHKPFLQFDQDYY